MPPKSSPAKPATKAPAKTATSAAISELVENLRRIEAEARHAADPREPVAELARLLADNFTKK